MAWGLSNVLIIFCVGVQVIILISADFAFILTCLEMVIAELVSLCEESSTCLDTLRV